MRKKATLRDEKTLEVVENEREKVEKSVCGKIKNRVKTGVKSKFFAKKGHLSWQKKAPIRSKNWKNGGEFTFLQL